MLPVYMNYKESSLLRGPSPVLRDVIWVKNVDQTVAPLAPPGLLCKAGTIHPCAVALMVSALPGFAALASLHWQTRPVLRIAAHMSRVSLEPPPCTLLTSQSFCLKP